jgi:hypothetical protein
VTVQLAFNSDAVGKLNPDGSINQWPVTDVRGGFYDRNGVTTLRVGSHFVVVPSGFNEKVEIEPEPEPVVPSLPEAWVEEVPDESSDY